MSPRVHRPVAWLSAALYSVVALVGYGLHDLGCCSHGDCGSSAAASTCGDANCPYHQHTDHKQDGATAQASASRPDSGQPGFQQPGHGHNPHTCSLCTLLTKIKVGYQSIEQGTVTTPLVADCPLPEPVRLSDELLLPGDVRGPPLAPLWT